MIRFLGRDPRATRVAEAPSHGKPILHYDPYSAGSASYEVAALELVKRLASTKSLAANRPSFYISARIKGY